MAMHCSFKNACVQSHFLDNSVALLHLETPLSKNVTIFSDINLNYDIRCYCVMHRYSLIQ